MKMIRALAACAGLLLTAAPSLAYDDSKSVTPTVQNAAYASGNSLGGLQTVSFFRLNAPNVAGGVLDAILLASKGGATVAVTFYIFDKAPTATTCTDKTAFAFGGADVDKLAVAPFTLTPAVTPGATITSAQLVQATSMRNKDTVPTANLYVCLVAGGAVTPASTTDLVFKLSGAID
jgi:hypothetical protein